MAHLSSIERDCQWPFSCSKKATHAVLNSRNGYCGEYCKKHAEKRLAEIQRMEATDRLLEERERR